MTCCCSYKAQSYWAAPGSLGTGETPSCSRHGSTRNPKIDVVVNQQSHTCRLQELRPSPEHRQGLGLGPAGLQDFWGGAWEPDQQKVQCAWCCCVVSSVFILPCYFINHLALGSQLRSFPLQLPTWRVLLSPTPSPAAGLPGPLLCGLLLSPRH